MANEHRKVWLYDKDLAWVKATVIDEAVGRTPRIITVERDDTSEKIQAEVDPQTGEGETVKSRNLFEEDSDIRGYEAVHDLTHLTHLHEAEILEALCVRFQNDQIYTYTGPILLAVNPFKELKIYTEDILGTYYSSGLLKSQQLDAPILRPHVFAIADAAYRNLMESGAGNQRMDQSILVSGESGAGKTETTKYVMRYLATVAKAEDADPSEKGRAERVLESNPILESFGNARTNRNDNSSRFGKFIQMSFDGKGFLVGAQIATYLLEKVRLTKQGKGERNFHVFYQMCAGASDEDRVKWLLPELTESLYTNQSDVYDRRDGIMDADQFVRTDEAFTKMKFTPEERDDIYSISSAVMNMGNITFDAIVVENNDGSAISGGLESVSLKNVSQLLQVNPDLLVTALTTKTITTGRETFKKALDVEEADVVRDALAKTIYSRMFDWIVKRVNLAISTDGQAAGKRATSVKHSFIGVLDIFGFEVFEHNSFEQLCINYANETLQQQFNEFVFQLEQKLYESEKIQWAFIDFPDNKPVLDLIEAKAPKPGILALLDEQCLFPQGNDKALANKLYDMLGGGGGGASKTSPAKAPAGASPVHPSNKSLLNTSAVGADNTDALLFASPADRRDSKFCVRHYAGVVTYSAIGFCAKNKDELRDEVIALMRTSTKTLVSHLFPESAKSQEVKAGSVQSETVGSQFKGQLASLLKTIKATSPHYVRCLKPNDQNVRETLVRPRLVDQLRYGGVLEAVKVARAGYPTRFSLRDFVRRYFMLSANMKLALSKRAQTFAADDERWVESCDMIVNGPEKLEKGTQYQIGRTKVFLRKSAFEKLETARSKIFKSNSVEIQKISRGFIRRRSYTKTLTAIRLIQRIARGFIARRRARAIRRNNAAIKIQAMVRKFVARSKFNRKKMAAIYIQSIARGYAGRKQAKAYRIFVKARTVQSFYRRIHAMQDFKRKRKAAIIIQTNWRGLAGRKALKELRMQQREAGYLREKIIELQKKINELEEELRQERAARKNAGVAVAQAVVKGEAVQEAKQEHGPPDRSIEDEPETKRKPPMVDGFAPSISEEELAALKEELALAKNARHEMRGELDQVQRELEAKSAALESAISERDSLAQGADPQEIAAKAIAERDAVRQELAASLAQADTLKRERQELEERSAELERKVQEAAATVSSKSDQGVAGNEEVENLRNELEARKAAHAKEVAQLKHALTENGASVPMAIDSSAADEAASLRKELEEMKGAHTAEVARLNAIIASNTQSASNSPQAAVATSKDADEKLANALKETERLKTLLARAKEEAAIIAQERDSLSELVSSSPEDLEKLLRSVTEERDRLQSELARQKEVHATLAAEKEAIASMVKAESSEDERLRAMAEREAIFEREKSKLAADLDVLTVERDELKTHLAEAKVALEKKAHSSPLTSIGGSRDGSEAASNDIDLELVRAAAKEHEIANEILVKENEDLKEENTRLQLRVHELAKSNMSEDGQPKAISDAGDVSGDALVMEHEELKEEHRMLQLRVEELEMMHKTLSESLAAEKEKKRSFFSRPSVMMSVPSVSLPTSATSSDPSKSLPTRSEVLASRCAELESKIAELTKQKDDLLAKIMELTNENNVKEIELRKQKRIGTDLNEKIEAMSLLAEQTSAIKIKLARRLDSLLQENTTLKQSLAELQDQVAAMQDVSRVLNDELMTRNAQLGLHEKDADRAVPSTTV